MNSSNLKALILSVSVLAALPLVGCAGQANPEDAVDETAEGTAEGGDEHVATTSSAFSVSSNTYDLGVYGGTGGTAGTLSCPTGSVVVGLFGRAANVIDRVGLVCAPLRADGTLGARSLTSSRGGTGGNSFRIECPANQVVHGFGFTWGSYVDNVRLKCGKAPFASSGYDTEWATSGFGWGGLEYPECRDNFVINAVGVRTGNVVDRMVPRCTNVGTR